VEKNLPFGGRAIKIHEKANKEMNKLVFEAYD
jgi:hypothetical protein